jgi:hypothetical protein
MATVLGATLKFFRADAMVQQAHHLRGETQA